MSASPEGLLAESWQSVGRWQDPWLQVPQFFYHFSALLTSFLLLVLCEEKGRVKKGLTDGVVETKG